MKKRTKQFSLRSIDMATALPDSQLGRIVQNQFIRAATSVASNYRAACRSKSKSDFTYKLSIVEEEADECMYWMEIIMEKKLHRREKVEPLYQEANKILSIIVKSIKTARPRSPATPNSKLQIPN